MHPIKVKPGLCKNCYACIRSCEVKATSIKQGQASLLEEECLSCGQCLAVCPQHAREIREDLSVVSNLLRGATPVWVSLAPSAVLGPWSFAEWEQRLMQVGFKGVSLTSWGAVPTTRAYVETANNEGYTLTTACPAAVKLVCRHFPRLAHRLAPVASPMQNHAAWLRQKYRAKVVFIGPCPAKKEEAVKSSVVDVALTFAEGDKLFGHRQPENTAILHRTFSSHGLTHFPIAGGLETQVDVSVLSIDGLSELMAFLTRLQNDTVRPMGIIEISACRGSCLGGANAYRRELTIAERRALVRELKEDNSHGSGPLRSVYLPLGKRLALPNDEAINEVLKQLGKTDPTLEYNCGACGYHTCREKAAAVVQGRAELEMCLPYMRTKAESLANLILRSTPNAVVVVDRDLKVQEWNEAAERMFKLPALQVLKRPLTSTIPSVDFAIVLDNNTSLSSKKLEINRDLIVSVNITPVKGGELAMGVFTDITQMEEQAKALAKVRHETLEKAQEVINKQMSVAQEIASLLGETTAESKMLLVKLMKVVQGEM
ncbi:MAG: putative PAS/PAC sensor protein [Bacillota bacterium]|nr:MAG: putative PAS/PAC sensor protein [Bacillota bacterium]